jgi:hypothetical protein
VRPRAADIAVPPLPPNLDWIGAEDPPSIDRLVAAGSVLVHFFDFAQLNSVRALPYVRGWHDRYRDAGVVVLGVHSPRFPFTAGVTAVRDAATRLGLAYPVAVDAGLRVWRAYGCRGWPSLFLWGRGGALRWFHFGEGEYRETEEAIRELVLESRPDASLPEPLAPLRPTDAPGALVMPPSEEVYPGGSADEPWEPGPERPEIELAYAAGGAYVSVDGRGALDAELDGRGGTTIAIDAPGLYEVALHDHHEEHGLRLRPTPGVRVWSVSFAAGVP